MGQDPQELNQDPQALRHDIERTREGMDATLNQIEDRISPSRIVERRKARVRKALSGARERVMGSADHMRTESRATADRAGVHLDHVSDELTGRVTRLQQEGKRQYRGNPLAAGLIVFGAGALLGSLIPKTEPEQQIAEDLADRLEPVGEELRTAGQEVLEEVKQEAHDRAEAVKDTAADAAQVMKEDARDSADHVRTEIDERAQHIKDDAQR